METFNVIAKVWFQIFPLTIIQNILFLLFILVLLHLFRNHDPKLLKGLTLIGLIKLFVPPIFPFPGEPAFIQDRIFTLSEILVNPNLIQTDKIALSIPVIAFILWLACAIFILVGFFVYQFIFRTKFKRIQLLNPQPSITEKSSAKLYISQYLHSPFVYGLFKPKIVVPENWKSWDKTSQEAVIQHELSHLKQGDNWLNLLKTLALALHFINPFVWILLKKVNYYSELISDNNAISSTKLQRGDYTKQLLNLARQTSNPLSSLSILSFSKTHKLIKQRIMYQLDKKENLIMKKLSTVSLIILLVTGFLIIPFSADIQPAVAEALGIAPTDSTFEFFDVDRKPVLTHKESPFYPEIARKAGIEGTVVITITIDKKGDVESAEIFKSSVKVLDEAAKQAALKCTFKPAKNGGKFVKVKMNVPFKFKLK